MSKRVEWTITIISTTLGFAVSFMPPAWLDNLSYEQRAYIALFFFFIAAVGMASLVADGVQRALYHLMPSVFMKKFHQKPLKQKSFLNLSDLESSEPIVWFKKFLEIKVAQGKEILAEGPAIGTPEIGYAPTDKYWKWLDQIHAVMKYAFPKITEPTSLRDQSLRQLQAPGTLAYKKSPTTKGIGPESFVSLLKEDLGFLEFLSTDTKTTDFQPAFNPRVLLEFERLD